MNQVNINKNSLEAVISHVRETEYDSWIEHITENGNVGNHILDHVFKLELQMNGEVHIEGVVCKSDEDIDQIINNIISNNEDLVNEMINDLDEYNKIDNNED